jgi:hypothetical protein
MGVVKKSSTEVVESDFIKAHSTKKSAEDILVKYLDTLQESLKEENVFGKVKRREIYWAWNESLGRISWRVQYGNKTIGNYESEDKNLEDAFNSVRGFIAGMRNRDDNWRELLKEANIVRLTVRKRLTNMETRKKMKKRK